VKRQWIAFPQIPARRRRTPTTDTDQQPQKILRASLLQRVTRFGPLKGFFAGDDETGGTKSVSVVFAKPL
jgi:hypothetical protein